MAAEGPADAPLETAELTVSREREELAAQLLESGGLSSGTLLWEMGWRGVPSEQREPVWGAALGVEALRLGDELGYRDYRDMQMEGLSDVEAEALEAEASRLCLHEDTALIGSWRAVALAVHMYFAGFALDHPHYSPMASGAWLLHIWSLHAVIDNHRSSVSSEGQQRDAENSSSVHVPVLEDDKTIHIEERAFWLSVAACLRLGLYSPRDERLAAIEGSSALRFLGGVLEADSEQAQALADASTNFFCRGYYARCGPDASSRALLLGRHFDFRLAYGLAGGPSLLLEVLARFSSSYLNDGASLPLSEIPPLLPLLPFNLVFGPILRSPLAPDLLNHFYLDARPSR